MKLYLHIGTPKTGSTSIQGRLTRGDRAMPPPQVIEECQALYSASNEAVRKARFPERQALFSPRAYRQAEPLNIPPVYLEKMADLIGALSHKVDRKAL